MVSSKRLKLSSKASLPFQTANKRRREDLYTKQKIAKERLSRDERFRRRREEDRNPRLRLERQKRNVPLTLDRKRKWDTVDPDTTDGFGLSVDAKELQRRVQEEEEATEKSAQDIGPEEDSEEDDLGSMLASDTDEDQEGDDGAKAKKRVRTATERATSPTQSTTSTNLDLRPEALAARFPSIFSEEPAPVPKILITTSINSTLHYEANLLTSLFPRSVYIPRSGHAHAHKYSVKEICSFACNRNYTAVLFLMEDQKRPCGLDFVQLPHGPMFHFNISSWVEGKRLPGHGRPTGHDPELILNNFRTPLGLLTATMLRRMFPPQPQLEGRQVVTMHNQRDYIFVRRHRYVFREKKQTEKAVVGSDGKEMKGAEGLKAGLQELGPRFTLKLRRGDKAIQRSSGQEWEWKGKMEKTRTKFQL